MCGNAPNIIYGTVQQYYRSTRTYSNLEPLVPGAAYPVPCTRYMQAQSRLQNQRYGGLFRAEKTLVSRDYLITRYKQSNAFLMRRRRRSAVSPRNLDPLRSTTLHGILRARRSRGNSSALNRRSCHASVWVMWDKRGGCCRTGGPRRVRSCQMLHTITAINAAWCRSLRLASSPRASDSASYGKFIATCSRR